jgi:pyruvate formate lyase activating enzyme
MLDLAARPPDLVREAGLHFVYTGNVRDQSGQSTYCPGCGDRLIGRDRYAITAWRLKNGRCGDCGIEIPGLFEACCGSLGNGACRSE